MHPDYVVKEFYFSNLSTIRASSKQVFAAIKYPRKEETNG